MLLIGVWETMHLFYWFKLKDIVRGVEMLKSCSKCGRVHEHNYKCKVQGVARVKADTIANKFRNTKAWRDKRSQIVIRDKGLCQICIRNLYDTIWTYI
jgi:hypothetical protein